MGKHKKSGNNKQSKSQEKPNTKNSNTEDVSESYIEETTSKGENTVEVSSAENAPNTKVIEESGDKNAPTEEANNVKITSPEIPTETKTTISADALGLDEENKKPVIESSNTGAIKDDSALVESQRKRIEELENDLAKSEENAGNYEMKYNNLLEKISSMKSIFHNMKEVKSELAESKSKIEELETDLKIKDGQIKQQSDKLKQKDDALKSQEELINDNQKDKLLIENLTANIQKYERQLKEINQMNDERFSSIETEQKTKDTFIRSLNEQLEEYLVVINEDKSVKIGLLDEINNFKNIIEQKDDEMKKISSEYAAHKTESVSKIDGLVDKIHELEAQNTRLKKDLAVSEETVKSLKSKASQNESQIGILQEKVENTARLEAEVKEKQLLIGKLRHEAIILNEHLTKALDIIKKNKEGNFVDKELISNLVLKFVALPRGDSKKFEVLSLISSYLDWSNEEKIEAGLVYK